MKTNLVKCPQCGAFTLTDGQRCLTCGASLVDEQERESIGIKKKPRWLARLGGTSGPQPWWVWLLETLGILILTVPVLSAYPTAMMVGMALPVLQKVSYQWALAPEGVVWIFETGYTALVVPQSCWTPAIIPPILFYAASGLSFLMAVGLTQERDFRAHSFWEHGYRCAVVLLVTWLILLFAIPVASIGLLSMGLGGCLCGGLLIISAIPCAVGFRKVIGDLYDLSTLRAEIAALPLTCLGSLSVIALLAWWGPILAGGFASP